MFRICIFMGKLSTFANDEVAKLLWRKKKTIYPTNLAEYMTSYLPWATSYTTLMYCELYFDQCVVIYSENIKFQMEFNMTNSFINYIVNKFWLILPPKKTNL